MALETATYIDGLVATNPAASDAINTADDHLRLIKSTLKNTFPNVTAAVTKTAAEINGLASQADLDALETTVTGLVAGVAAVPSGAIVMCSGSIAAIPSGWFLCDGNNGTPNLRDRFIVGAGSSYAVGATGGSKDAIVVSHDHTGTTNTKSLTGSVSGIAESFALGGGTASGVFSKTTGNTVNFTTIDNDAGDGGGFTFDGSHNHPFTTNSTGSSGTNANLPPYYALAYIMKA